MGTHLEMFTFLCWLGCLQMSEAPSHAQSSCTSNHIPQTITVHLYLKYILHVWTLWQHFLKGIISFKIKHKKMSCEDRLYSNFTGGIKWPKWESCAADQERQREKQESYETMHRWLLMPFCLSSLLSFVSLQVTQMPSPCKTKSREQKSL